MNSQGLKKLITVVLYTNMVYWNYMDIEYEQLIDKSWHDQCIKWLNIKWKKNNNSAVMLMWFNSRVFSMFKMIKRYNLIWMNWPGLCPFSRAQKETQIAWRKFTTSDTAWERRETAGMIIRQGVMEGKEVWHAGCGIVATCFTMG